MKKIYSLLILTLLFFNTKAQFTLSASDFPATGETLQMITSDSSYFSLGGTGLGAVWYETQYSSNGGSVTDSFMDVSQTPFASKYAHANLAVHEIVNHGATGNSNNYIYFNKTGSGMERIGSEASTGGVAIVYSTPANQYYFPITYSDNFNGYYGGNYPTAGGNTTTNGTDTVMADGFGTLHSPLGTFHNVMRVKTWRTETDTIYPLNKVAHIYDYYWDWYQVGKYYPIFRINRFILNSSVTNQYYLNISYRMGDTTSVVTGISNAAGSPLQAYLFPNPAGESTTLMIEHSSSSPVEINIYSIDGRLIRKAAQITGNGLQTALINTADLNSGLYLLEVNDKGNRSFLKLQVVH